MSVVLRKSAPLFCTCTKCEPHIVVIEEGQGVREVLQANQNWSNIPKQHWS